jgi:oxalate decarboxylase
LCFLSNYFAVIKIIFGESFALTEKPPYIIKCTDKVTGNFDAVGTTFMVDDVSQLSPASVAFLFFSAKATITNFPTTQWIAHTPLEVLAKNFGVNASVFSTIPTPDPYILNGTVSTSNVTGASSGLFGNSSYVFHQSQLSAVPVPGGGGNLSIIDSRNFPIATTIAAAVISLEPNGLR